MVRPIGIGLAAALALGAALTVPLRAASEGSAASERAAVPMPPAPVREALLRHLPPLWKLEAMSIDTVPPDGNGSAEAPVSARIAARVRLTRTTYAVEHREGTATFIRPVAEAGFEKVLTGTATAVRRDDSWAVTLDLTNTEVLDSVGRPAAELPGRTAIVGTEEARRLRDQLDRDARQRFEQEQAERRRQEQLLAQQAAAARAEADLVAEKRRGIEERARQIETLRALLESKEWAERVAAFEAALGGNDAALRQLALDTALSGKDPTLANMALKDWFVRKRTVPVQLYATKEDPASETVLRNLGALTLDIDSFNPVAGTFGGKMGAAGYSITAPSAMVGSLAQTEVTANAYGCSLTLRLSAFRTLDGVYRCQTLPTLIARITLD